MSGALPPDRMPVIVGIGEITDRPPDPAQGLEPLALMEQALRRAEQDAGCSLLARIDSLDIVNQVTWPYDDMPAQLSARIGAAPRHAYYGPVGGESPIRYLHQAAARIARGETAMAAVCGAEAQSTLTKARRANIALDWTPKPEKFDPPLRGIDFLHAAAINLGVFMPVTVYPFYENATAASWGQTPAEALAESGRLWSKYAGVAAQNPYAWLRRDYTPEEITTPSADNRLIAWPYTKLMVANPNVNQGAAVILTSLAFARQAGIPDERCIFVHGGAAANEPRDYLERDNYTGSTAQDAVLHAVSDMAGQAGFTATELYSCFPCVPKMAARTLGLAKDAVPTVTGGLTFFGAPLNTYMTNAACAMTRRLRQEGGTGLLYGQGEFVTKHHGLVVSATPPGGDAILRPASVQQEADSRRGYVPPFSTTAHGKGTLETFTVIYDREGAASHGVVIALLATGERVLARLSGDARDGIAQLCDPKKSPIGAAGKIVETNDELHWEFG
jgi:acetyl-CoA C-acetyltransferase